MHRQWSLTCIIYFKENFKIRFYYLSTTPCLYSHRDEISSSRIPLFPFLSPSFFSSFYLKSLLLASLIRITIIFYIKSFFALWSFSRDSFWLANFHLLLSHHFSIYAIIPNLRFNKLRKCPIINKDVTAVGSLRFSVKT